MAYSKKDQERLDTYMSVHLRKKEDLPNSEKIPELEKKRRNKYIQFVLNLVIIILFIYAYLFDVTTFGDWFFYLIFGVFAINMILLYVQRNQLNELIEYVNYNIDRGSA